MNKIVHGFTTEHSFVSDRQIMAATDEEFKEAIKLNHIEYLRFKLKKLTEVIKHTEPLQIKDERASLRLRYRQKALEKTIRDLKVCER
jgi:hypothetical protein